MTIPFVKAHGAGNDFLFTSSQSLREPLGEERLPELARAICNRHTGVGADGWYLVVQPSEGHHAEIRLYNSDGSKAELSGNGTRCAAAMLVEAGLPITTVRILTGSGARVLKLIERNGRGFRFEMDMGKLGSKPEQVRFALPEGGAEQPEPEPPPLPPPEPVPVPAESEGGESAPQEAPAPAAAPPPPPKSLVKTREVTIVDVGNPQCAVVVQSFDIDWRSLGASIEKHPQFPKGTNVSFVRKVDPHTIEARFWERGAGATLSSGTGAAGAAAAAILLGLATSPVRVVTEAGDLEVAWPDAQGSARLTGPAQITARGEFFW